METIQKDSADVGIIVGRFQVDDLTEGHIDLIKQVYESHTKTVIFLGLSMCKCTVRNPLDFETRKIMIQALFPDANVLYIKDINTNKLWSQNLDDQIETNTSATDQTVCLYGSRDSFIRHYTGKHRCCELEQTIFVSGTERRKSLAVKVNKTADFRHGVIWAVNNQYPKALPTVDMGILNSDHTKILLARKTNEKDYRFVGGFVQPGETYEDAAFRETREETHLVVNSIEYVQSFVIDDWRYRGEIDKITTSLFVTDNFTGTPEPDDDICELKWFNFKVRLKESITDEHKPLFAAICKKYDKWMH